VRLADIPEDADHASEEQRVLPGDSGVVDCGGALAILGGMEYEGPVTLHPDPSRFSGMTRDAIVQRAASVLDEQWKSAGLNKAGKLAPAPAEP
jgi:sugar phosphate isomerase/epimerase